MSHDWQAAWLNSADDPWLFATGVLGFLPAGVENPNKRPQLEKWQDGFLRGFCKHPRHSVRAGHGVGKGTVIAILALWFVSTSFDAKCVLTANSQDQLRDNNWPELKKWWREMPPALRQQVQVDEERAYLASAPEMSFVVRRTASADRPEALQGIHARRVLYLVDEASGIPDIVFEVAQGALSTDGSMVGLFSNPTRGSGFFHKTHNELREHWKTYVVNGEDVPRAAKAVREYAQLYGRESNTFRVRVLGEFPSTADDVVITLRSVLDAQERKVNVDKVYPIWGVDVAGHGDDASALAKRQGNHLLEAPKTWKNLDPDQLAIKIAMEYAATPRSLRPSEILIDNIGVGYGLAGHLQRTHHLRMARSVNVSANTLRHANCYRLRDELWWAARLWFASGNAVIPAKGVERMIAQLTTPTYDHTVTGKVVVESKEDFKQRIGHSPDEADAFLLTFAGTPKPRDDTDHGRDRWDAESRGATGWTG